MHYQERPGVRLLNAALGVKSRLGWRRVEFAPDRLEALARREAGGRDFGPQRYRAPLEILCQDYDQDARLTPVGRLVCQGNLLHGLRNRLLIQRALQDDPGIAQEEIRRPLFVLGLPRTGTTYLFNLLAEDPSSRPLMFWESMRPAPCPRPETYQTDPRITRGRKRITRLNQIFPELQQIHEFRWDGPEECLGLLMNSLLTPFFRGDIPGYRDWLDAIPDSEVDAVYAEHRLQLQLLQRHVRNEHWILKCPSHLYGLGSLLTTYPDAAVVQTHRALAKSVPSLCSLSSIVEQLCYRRVDGQAIGRQTVRSVEQLLQRGLRGRDRVDPRGERVMDLDFQAIVSDPLGTVRSIYERFGYPFTPVYEQKLKQYIAADQHDRQPKHAYRLSEFGLTEHELRTRFQDYRERFPGSDPAPSGRVAVAVHLDAPPGKPFTATHGPATIEYFSRGSGPTVVLLPALAADGQEFAPLVTALNFAGYRTLTINFPGVGHSDQPIRSFPTLWDFADYITTVLEDAGVPGGERIVLVGRGLGNRVARAFATRHTHRTAAVVLLGAGGQGGGRPPRGIIRKYLALQWPGMSLARRREILETMLCVRRNVLPEAYCRKPPLRALRLQAGAVRRTPSRLWWAGGTAPILVVQGAQDQVAPPALAEALKREFPQRVQVCLQPDAGHALLFDQPDAVTESILGYLRTMQFSG